MKERMTSEVEMAKAKREARVRVESERRDEGGGGAMAARGRREAGAFRRGGSPTRRDTWGGPFEGKRTRGVVADA